MKKNKNHKKVALLTCFLNNYGACLQAYALQKTIENMGCDCDIIAYVEPYGYGDFEIDRKTAIEMQKRTLIEDVRYKFKKNRPFSHQKKYLSFYNFRNNYLKFEKENNKKFIKFYHKMEDFEGISDKYDAFVCGSDQIWNPTFYGKNNPAYFLTFAKNKKRIAYSPSIGLPDIPQEYQEEFTSYVSKFDFLSVREEKGAEIIKKLCHREAKVVLDPTILAGRRFWSNLLKKKYTTHYKKYIFCYIFSNTKNCSEYLQKVQQKTGLPIIYTSISNLSYDNLDATCMQYAGPVEFLQLIKHSEFVLTDSFHGTAFSLLLNKDFYVFKRERNDEKIDMYSRIDSILHQANLENRAISIDENFTTKLPINFEEVNLVLEKLRKDSYSYLKKALLED